MHSTRSSKRLARFGLLVLAGMVLTLPSGCVRRRMTIRSNPPGALVYVDDQEIGVTPVSASYTYYGTRKVQLMRDGYEPLTVKQPFPVPWYQFPPLDFFFENVWPFELRDERVLDFDMQPQQAVPNEQVIERAEMLRGSNRAGVVAPLP